MHDLPAARQCQMLSRGRSTAYYRAQEVSEAELVLMCRIDALHLEHPFAGSRMLRDMLRRDGHSIGRSVRVRQRYAGCAGTRTTQSA